MTSRKVLVVSLNFNPGHYSHLVANCKLIAEAGFEPILYIHPKFNEMDAEGCFRRVNRPGELCLLGEIEYAVFWFPSLLNVVEIIRLRWTYKSYIIYVYHEPFESVTRYVESGMGILRVCKVALIHLVNLVIIWLSNYIVLPSASAYNIYWSKYRGINARCSIIPLMFDDESEPGDLLRRKTKISYIGTAAEDHAFDKFLAFAAFAIRGEMLSEFGFVIATRSVIAPDNMRIVSELIRSGRLAVFQGRPLGTREINCFFCDSLVVWNAYNRSMQSGVLPKAYMFGAAIIGAQSGATEHIDNHVTGVVVCSNADVLELRCAVEEIASRRNEFFRAARAKFLATFYYRVASDKFMAILLPVRSDQ
jgi:hypothetical protein